MSTLINYIGNKMKHSTLKRLQKALYTAKKAADKAYNLYLDNYLDESDHP